MNCADNNQCCDACSKPADQKQDGQLSAEQYEAIIAKLMERLQTADTVITCLLRHAGGSVTLTKEIAASVLGCQVVGKNTENDDYVLCIVDAAQTATVQ